MPGSGASGSDWYHPDCWVAVRDSEQERYERQVATAGISALLAPYLSAAPATEVPVPAGPFPEQPPV